VREERGKIKSELNQLKNELAAKNEIIDNLQTQLEEKETAIVTCETQLQQVLEPISPPAVVSPELDVTEGMQNEISLGVKQRLIEFVGERKSQAKDTRNWFQANKMITELEKILSIE